MKLVIGINIQRYKEKPLFQVTVEDIDNPINFHSYECLFFKSCNTLEELEEVKNKAQLFINTLEVKEVDLDKEIDLLEDKYYGFESLSRADIIEIIKHSFELGLKAQKGEKV